MSRRRARIDIEAARIETTRSQAQAADPAASVWVNANAGTGKTHVLTQRVLRLLLANTKPERILCLTYTKAAAAEMAKRVFETLGAWVTAPEAGLDNKLSDVLGRLPNADERKLARKLFTKAIETPGGLKVQTIHAFAERLLQRFPLEAGVAPGFKILDDEKGRELVARAIDGALKEATGTPDSALGDALRLTVRYAADQSFDDLLGKAVAERAWFEAASRISLGDGGDDFDGANRLLRRAFNLTPGASRASLEAALDGVLSRETLAALRGHLTGGGKTDVDHAGLIGEVLGQADRGARVERLASYFLVNLGTTKEQPRSSLMSRALAGTRPDLLAAAEAAQKKFAEIRAQQSALAVVDASLALCRLTGGVLQRYRDSKRAAGALDFDDLIQHTRRLLDGKTSADWVLYKLDGGLDHILVDEAQDTSPHQWQIITALAREFFSGSGARDDVRTVFAVGDEKQSIYSFQGAAPERFAETGAAFAALARAADLAWREIPLSLSFRTVQPILDAVDAVFGDATVTPGLSARAVTIEHVASRSGHAGLIEVWETERHRDGSEADPWTPLDDRSEQAPVNRLAERIADTIAGWLKEKTCLPSTGLPIRAGDILILVRKRHPFALPMVAALKKRHIPVAGSDRIALTDQIAVRDLVALGDFLTLPEDDLQLANVLKGPLFNLDDDDLLAFAPKRKGSLWKALLAHADGAARLKPAAETLKRWRAKADFAPPFEFFAGVLDRDGGRARMLARLGPEAADAIDEFLDSALAYDDGAPPSLTGFLAHLRAARREVKRDMEHGRDEVRVMTVHGAKGLEAPIVFLPDTCTTASGDGAGPQLLKLTDAELPVGFSEDPLVWPVKGTAGVPAIIAARRAKTARENEERNRLLYVAMTRARDRLYVAGFEPRNGRAVGCWYDLINSALKAQCGDLPSPGDGIAVRIETPQSVDAEPAKAAAPRTLPATELPAFATTRAAAEPRFSIPLQPSRLEPYAPDGEGEPLPRTDRDPASPRDAPSPLAKGSEYRFLRGTLTHVLLQHLAAIAPERREKIASEFLARRGAALSGAARETIVRETLAVLADPSFAAIFGPASRAEVPVSAILPRPGGRGPALELSGQIDRLAVTDDEILIVDYKTNRPPPTDVVQVADAYLYQLAAYGLALAEIYPGRRVRSALLWTDGPRLMEIPPSLLATFQARLWDLDVARLDAA